MATRHLHPVLALNVPDAQERIRVLLAADTHAGLDQGIAALSQHLAAGERVLVPAMRARAGETATASTYVFHVRDLQTQLRALQQANNGDSHARSLDLHHGQQRIARDFDAFAAEETALLRDLEAVLSQLAWVDLLERWHDALAHAPTRPHPFTPQRRGIAGVAFRVVGWWDHVLDTLDSRPVQRPRATGPRRFPGRWGHYLLGQAPRRRS